ncbi:MAG: beta-lactamase family protein [Patescibacteria group bacterium]|nr:beta-lactamase family protein [Patescibacteria group bacterium]
MLSIHPDFSTFSRVITQSADCQRFYDRIPGISIGIVHNRETTITTGIRHANQISGERFTLDITCRIASISKIFTAIVVLQLVQEKNCIWTSMSSIACQSFLPGK